MVVAVTDKATVFYQGCMEEEAIDERGIDPVLSVLAEASWEASTAWTPTDYEGLTRALGWLHAHDFDALFYLGVWADAKNASANVTAAVSVVWSALSD